MLSLLNQCNDFNLLLPVLDRILLISWLLKDFGWMTTNVYLGWPFGFISIVLHIVILFVDPRPAFRFYNISLLLWVCGNFIWMSIEYIHVNPSSNVHFGPKTPIGVMDSETVSALVDFKGFLFLASTSIQIIMYVGIYVGKIPMAEDDNEDIIARNEIALLIGEKHLSLQQVDGLIQTNNNDNNDTPRRGISIAFIDYLYVIFWISKDLFWSWGTGDFYTKGKATAVSFESLAILFGFLSLFAYILCAYIRRRQLRGFVDALTTLFWISANFIWMSGEFFLRYQNEELDDADEGSDQSTRIASSCFFCLGLSLQIILIGYITWKAMDYPYVEMCFKSNIRNNSSNSNTRRKASARIQMFSITDENNILPVYSPQHKMMISDADDIAEDEVVVLF